MHAEQVANGLSAASEMLNGVATILKDGKAHKTLFNLASKFAPFLGAYAPVVAIFGLFGSSPELQRLDHAIGLLNDGFRRMEYRFDSLEMSIEDLGKNIEKAHFWTRIKPGLQAFDSIDARVKDYFAVTNPTYRQQRAKFLDKQQYHKIYDAIDALNNDFIGKYPTGSICQEVTHFTSNDRRATVNIITDLYTRLMRGAMNLIFIKKILKHTDIPPTETEMKNMLVRIAGLVKECDRKIAEETWLTTWPGDLDSALKANDDKTGK